MSTWIGIGRSETGLVRTSNQDAFAVIDSAGMWAVADGMGGHVGGAVAAQTAIATVQAQAAFSQEQLRSGTSPIDVLTALISRAHEAILAQARSQPKLKGMGTTLVLLTVIPDQTSMAYVAHIGDSRAYRFRAGALTPLTRDHSLIEKYLERGILTPETAKTHPERHVLTRALGVTATAAPTIAGCAMHEDDLVILCSDGLTKMLEDQDIQRVLCNGDPSPAGACDRLIAAALDRGGEDNVTVVVVAYR
ncbi:MAG: serine/threonine-protein phosphatase [Nitrospira sp.]|uniref:PP2C family protein-serine/threonine phosphatase n=1 Tax=Nitrospira sp. BLG_1 TaxID=3395883 RepID=UPI001D4186C4|nr:serine/threonine-protein phosphatase [Nitrospira sp.]MBX3348029.1 serine/threonine-protein phosphatase [Nitrospira sp.]